MKGVKQEGPPNSESTERCPCMSTSDSALSQHALRFVNTNELRKEHKELLISPTLVLLLSPASLIRMHYNGHVIEWRFMQSLQCGSTSHANFGSDQWYWRNSAVEKHNLKLNFRITLVLTHDQYSQPSIACRSPPPPRRRFCVGGGRRSLIEWTSHELGGHQMLSSCGELGSRTDSVL